MRKVVITAIIALAIAASGVAFSGSHLQVEVCAANDPQVIVKENLVKDSSFESVTATDSGDWVFKTGVSDESKKGKIEIDADNFTDGRQALKIYTSASSNDAPEVHQIVEVEKNVDYELTLKLRNNLYAMSGANLFFGIGSSVYENGTDYAQQHRWNTNTTYTGNDFEDDPEASDEGFTLMSAIFNTGNRTSLRIFIRVMKMNATVDEVTFARHESILPAGRENLLKQSGFEGTDEENKQAWSYSSTVSEGGIYGFNDVRSTSIYQPGQEMQDKQMEGFKTAFIGASSGVADAEISIDQGVTVEKNTNYAFYAYLSKWGELGNSSIGVKGAEGNYLPNGKDQVAKKEISNDAISCSRYVLASIVVNSGDNTLLYPTFTCGVGASSGQWGVGMYIDDTSFYKVDNDLPAGKTNVVQNGDFNTEHAWTVQVPGEGGLEASAADSGQKYAGSGKAWFKQWEAHSGIRQTVSLLADTFYKITARVQPYYGGACSKHDVPLTVKLTDAENAVVAKGNYSLEGNSAYIPVGLIAKSGTAGEYTLTIEFEFAAQAHWCGGVNIGAVTMYAATEQELFPDSGEDPVEPLLSLDSKVVLGENNITVSESMVVSRFKGMLQAAAGYSVTVIDTSGKAVDDGSKLLSEHRVQIIDGDGTEVKTYTLTVPDGVNSPIGNNGKPNVGLIVGLSVGGGVLAIGIVAAILIVLKKKKQKM